MAEKKKAFSISDFVKPEDVSSLDTPATAGKIINVPVESLQVNEKNFYDTSNVADLVKSIALNGLIEPIIVTPTEPIPGHSGPAYRIISGHRRFSAWQTLMSDDPVKYAAIPSIVRMPANEIMEELLLIEANRATRVMSSADTAKQAERYMDLLARLKESGVEIPGRLRDVVSEAMGISSSRLARLKVIREGLIPEMMTKFESEKLNESAAYELARISPENQRLMARKDGEKLTAYDVEHLDAFAKACFEDHECKCVKTSNCNHGEAFWNASKGKDNWNQCVPGSWSEHGNKCCLDCNKSEKCKFVCDKALPTIKRRIEKEAKEAAKKKADEAKKLEREDKKAAELWKHVVDICEKNGATRAEIAKIFYTSEETVNEHYEGKFGSYDYSAKEYKYWSIDKIIDLAKLAGCSVNLLLNLDYPCNYEKTAEAPYSGWRSLDFDPPVEGQEIITLNSAGELNPSLFFSDTFDGNKLVGWIPFPEVPDAV